MLSKSTYAHFYIAFMLFMNLILAQNGEDFDNTPGDEEPVNKDSLKFKYLFFRED